MRVLTSMPSVTGFNLKHSCSYQFETKGFRIAAEKAPANCHGRVMKEMTKPCR